MSPKDAAIKAVESLILKFRQNEDSYTGTGYNETQVRREFIDPFFEALGWDISNKQGLAEQYKDVIHEDAVKVGEQTKAPDYSFRVGGVRKFFVEAKKPSVSIKEDVMPADWFKNWGNGCNAGIGATFQLFPVVQFGAHATYDYFPYVKAPDICYPMVWGVEHRIEGESSYGFGATVAMRLHEPSDRAGLCLTLRGGVLYMRVGRISLIEWPNDNPDSLANEAYAGSDVREIKPFGSIGLGFRVPVTHRLNVLLDCAYTATSDGKQRFFPVMATVQYGLGAKK